MRIVKGQPITTQIRVLLLFLSLVLKSHATAAPIEIHIDKSENSATIRPLHGVNKGPLGPGGLIDLTEEFKAIQIPSIRLHDCHWPNPDVVDFRAVFPNLDADPSDPASYQFALTDEYIQACLNTGAKIVFRLGESIEHTSIKRFVHPPADPKKWADICIGIIRHYNEGWAGGFRHGITHWEIWNEPENRPAMWTGTDEQFLDLYKTAAKRIKEQFPNLKVGGPAYGHSGDYKGGQFTPSKFVLRFLQMCRDEKVPLDFFSWHCYTDDPSELAGRAKAIRKLLDEHGFEKTESHLNEWNYLPGNSWGPLGKKVTATERQAFYEQMGGAPGAAFVIASLIQLQAAPVDVSNLFHGELGGFGLFNEHGVPNQVYRALELWAAVSSQIKLTIEKDALHPGKLDMVAAQTTGGNVRLLITNRGELQEIKIGFGKSLIPPGKESAAHVISLSSSGLGKAAVHVANEKEENLETYVRVPGPGVTLVEIAFRLP